MIDMPDFILENSFFMVILWVVIFVLFIPLVWFGMVVFLMPIHMLNHQFVQNYIWKET